MVHCSHGTVSQVTFSVDGAGSKDFVSEWTCQAYFFLKESTV